MAAIRLIFRIVANMFSITVSLHSPIFTLIGNHFTRRLTLSRVLLVSMRPPTLCITTLRAYRSLLTRTGNLDDVASCFYATLSDNPNIVYYDAFGTLRFARGESTKTISIPNPLRKFNLKTSVYGLSSLITRATPLSSEALRKPL